MPVKINHSGLKRTNTSEDLIELIGRFAQHSSDAQIAMILAKQGRLTATGLPFTASRVAGIRERAAIPAARAEGAGDGVSIRQLGVCTQTIRRWLAEGLLPAEQTTAHAPRRIGLTDEIRRRFVPEVPDGYVRLADAACRLGVSRETVLNQVRAGQRHAIHVTNGKRCGLRIQLHSREQGLLDTRHATS